jgi:hypothetical protein
VVAVAKSEYGTATARLGIQVQEGDLDFFVVQLEDSTTYKQVAVFEGQATLIKEITKGN